MANIDLVHEGDEYSRHSTIRISSGLFFNQRLRNVEYTSIFLDFCVLADFRSRQDFIDEAENNPHVSTLVLYEYIENVALIAGHSQLLFQFLKDLRL